MQLVRDMMRLGSVWIGVLLVAAAALIWGTLGILFTFILRYGMDASTLAFWRASLAATAMVTGLAVAQPKLLRIRRRDVPFFLLFGVLSIGGLSVVYIQAVDRVGVATAAVLLYTAPAWVTVLAWRLYGEPLTRLKIAALVLAFLGTVLVAQAHDLARLRVNATGLLFGLASGFTYAMYTIFSRRSLRNYSALTTVTYSLVFAGLVLAPLVSPGDVRLVIGGPPTLWGLLITLALGPTVGSYLLYTRGLQYIEASVASITAMLEPVSAAVLGYVILHQRLAPVQILGGALILTAVGLLAMSQRSNKG